MFPPDAGNSAHSPSKVFAEIGGYTGEGFARGVDDSTGQAQSSLANMVDPTAAADKAAGSVSVGGKTSVGDITININGAGKDAQSIALEVRKQLIDLLEED